MPKRSKKPTSSPRRSDRQVKEFTGRDLGDDIRASGAAIVVRTKRKSVPTSILLSPDLVEKLRNKAAKRGLGYQTMLKLIVNEHIDDY